MRQVNTTTTAKERSKSRHSLYPLRECPADGCVNVAQVHYGICRVDCQVCCSTHDIAAITSNNASVRKLGAAGWRNLHKLAYVAVVLGGIHYIWLVKGIQMEPLIYMAVILGLLGVRLTGKRRARAA